MAQKRSEPVLVMPPPLHSTCISAAPPQQPRSSPQSRSLLEHTCQRVVAAGRVRTRVHPGLRRRAGWRRRARGHRWPSLLSCDHGTRADALARAARPCISNVSRLAPRSSFLSLFTPCSSCGASCPCGPAALRPCGPAALRPSGPAALRPCGASQMHKARAALRRARVFCRHQGCCCGKKSITRSGRPPLHTTPARMTARRPQPMRKRPAPARSSR